MSTALDIIIARGFDSPIQGAMDSFNNQRQANNSNKLSGILQQNAAQDQQWQGEDRARADQLAQQGQVQQAALQDLYGRAEQLAALDPSDPQVQAQWRQIAIEKERITGEGSAFRDILQPKSSASPARPVIVQGPDGPVYADAASAVGQAPYIKPTQAAAPPSPTKPPTGYTWRDPSNPAAGVSPLAGGPADPSVVQPISPAEATENRKAATAKAEALKTYGTYQTAMKAVGDSLANTTTGPVLGRLPAFSSEQQIAEGAVAAIAPILKQLFRSAGEGVFTDKDQALLMDMVPTRADRQDVKDAKIANINAIVAAKLGIAPAGAPKAPTDMSDDELMEALK